MVARAGSTLRSLVLGLALTGVASLRTVPLGGLFAANISREDISLEELRGETPVLVDAVLDASQAKVYVILNTKHLGKNYVHEYEQLATAEWLCRWGDHSPSLRLDQLRSVTQGNPHAWPSHPRKWPLPPDSAIEDGRRITLVITCPVPDGGATASALSVTATVGRGRQVYARHGIHVRKRVLFNRSDTALCTMAINNASASPYMRQWVQYHLNLGFDQILMYIEDKDPSWAQKALRDFVEEGRVRLVHFHFGELSDSQEWIMQEAQEHHCLYHARGRVSWLGHCDIDEYFEVKKGGDLKRLLQTFSANATGVVSVQSQFWYLPKKHVSAKEAELPCDMTCKDPGYFTNKRQKLFMNPDNVSYYTIHEPTRFCGNFHVADPETEVRLNHFKAIPDGTGKKCRMDLSFQKYCKTMVSLTQSAQNKSRGSAQSWSSRRSK